MKSQRSLSDALIVWEKGLVADKTFKVVFPIYRIGAAGATVGHEVVLFTLAPSIKAVSISSLNKYLLGDIVDWDNICNQFFVASHILQYSKPSQQSNAGQ